MTWTQTTAMTGLMLLLEDEQVQLACLKRKLGWLYIDVPKIGIRELNTNRGCPWFVNRDRYELLRSLTTSFTINHAVRCSGNSATDLADNPFNAGLKPLFLWQTQSLVLQALPARAFGFSVSIFHFFVGVLDLSWGGNGCFC